MIFRLHNLLISGLAIVAAAAAGSSRPPKAHELDASYTFTQYLSHFDKSYDDPEEYGRRSAIFAKNMEKILKHNEGRMTETGEVKSGYVMGVNMFTDVEPQELPMGFNRNMHPAWRSQLMGLNSVATERMLGATSEYSVPPAFTNDKVSDLPEKKDWVDEGVVNPIIPSQGGCGSCWTFAAIGTIEAHWSITTGEPPVSLSETNLLLCSPNPDECGGNGGCSGATVELAYNYAADATKNKKGGLFTLGELPYSPSDGSCDDTLKGKTPTVGIKGWTKLPANDYESTMNALAKVGPLALAVAAGGWGAYEKGVFESEDTEIDHAVLLVGYGTDEKTGEKYYKIRNSWGQQFGEDGFIRIKRTDDDSTLCKMDTTPLVGTSCALDDNGKTIDVNPVKICATSGVLFDVAFPVEPYLLN